MPTHRNHPDLLFALLAAETGVLSRDQFFEAIQTWAASESRGTLAAWIEDRGWIDADQRTSLETLVRSRQGRASTNSPFAGATASSSDVSRSATEASPVGAETVSLGSVGIAPAVSTDLTALGSGKPESRFAVQRLHAEGGLGRVYVAHDRQLDREVALKEIKEQHADNLASRRRFVLEAEVTGGLEHPGIVPVYGLGHYEDGRPYYTMRFIRGTSLSEAIKEFHQSEMESTPTQRTVALRRLLNRFVDVCQAVQYAHRRGVLHRDLKPSNIMLGDYGETLVVDWGLAKVIPSGEPRDGDRLSDEDTLLPRSDVEVADSILGQAIGSPSYMSPEQARGERDQLGPATDVYSLGATLYTILTNHAPVESDSTDEILARVRCGDWSPPRIVASAVPKPLDAICCRAMAHEPAQRYSSVAELAQDVEQYLADLPVTAYRERISEQASRIARRHRSWVAGIAVSLVLTTGISLFAAISNRNQRIDAEQARLQAQQLAFENEMLAEKERQGRELLERRTTEIEQARANLQRFEHIGFFGGLLQSQPMSVENLERAIRDIQAQFARDPFGQARLLSTLAAKYRSAKHYEAAERLFGLSIGTYTRVLPRFDPIVISTTMELATTFAMAGEPKKALDIAEKALAACHLEATPNPALTIEAMNLVVFIHMELSNFDDAQRIADAAVELAESSAGIAPETVRNQRNLKWSVQLTRERIPEGLRNVLAAQFGKTFDEPERVRQLRDSLLQGVRMNWLSGAEMALPAIANQAVDMFPRTASGEDPSLPRGGKRLPDVALPPPDLGPRPEASLLPGQNPAAGTDDRSPRLPLGVPPRPGSSLRP